MKSALPAVRTERLPAPRRLPVPGLLDPWLGNYPSVRTKEAYGGDVEMWAAWCEEQGVDLLHPRAGHLSAWTEGLRANGASQATVARRVSSVLVFYKWARFEGITTADPAPFRRQKVHRDDVAILGLTGPQFVAVCRAANGPRNLAFVTLLGRCGLRVSEALDADISALTEIGGHRVIQVVGKGDKPRTVPVPPPAWRNIHAYLAGRKSGPIFITRTGKRWERRDAWETVGRIGERAGIHDLHPHRLRHTTATLMLEAGAPLDRVQLVMGHASPQTTMRYARGRDRLDGSAVYDLDRYLATIDDEL